MGIAVVGGLIYGSLRTISRIVERRKGGFDEGGYLGMAAQIFDSIPRGRHENHARRDTFDVKVKGEVNK